MTKSQQNSGIWPARNWETDQQKRRFATEKWIHMSKFWESHRKQQKMGCKAFWKGGRTRISGWWCNNHLEKYEFVNGKDYPIYEMENKNVWNHQPENIVSNNNCCLQEFPTNAVSHDLEINAALKLVASELESSLLVESMPRLPTITWQGEQQNVPKMGEQCCSHVLFRKNSKDRF